MTLPESEELHLYATRKKREPCPGQPKVIVGSKWLQEREKVTRFKGYRRTTHHYKPWNKRKGLEGERYVLDRILANLDACWVVFTNLEVFVREGDIDIVLVGPGGILAVEVKTFSRDLYVIHDDWLLFEGDIPEPYSGASRQARENAFKLQLYLEDNGFNAMLVSPIVVVASDSDVTVFDSEVEVWCKKDLDTQLRLLNQYETLAPEQVAIVVSILSKD